MGQIKNIKLHIVTDIKSWLASSKQDVSNKTHNNNNNNNMKLWSTNHIFSAPWKCTTEGMWKKYPNERQPHVKTIDVLDRHVTEDGRLLTTRLFGTRFSFPSLIVQLLGLPDMCYAIEYSEVDLKTQTMTLRMINSTFNSVLSVDEVLVFKPNRDNPLETHLKQSARIGIHGIPFSGYFEDMLVDNFSNNSKVGRGAVEMVVSTLAVGNIITGVTKELQLLSQEVDNLVDDAMSGSIGERMADLAKELDRASGMINEEMRLFSDKLHADLLQVVSSLETELSQISVKVNLTEVSCAFESSRLGLLEAVMQAGIAVEAPSS